jgi:hypothetical protein
MNKRRRTDPLPMGADLSLVALDKLVDKAGEALYGPRKPLISKDKAHIARLSGRVPAGSGRRLVR